MCLDEGKSFIAPSYQGRTLSGWAPTHPPRGGRGMFTKHEAHSPCKKNLRKGAVKINGGVGVWCKFCNKGASPNKGAPLFSEGYLNSKFHVFGHIQGSNFSAPQGADLGGHWDQYKSTEKFICRGWVSQEPLGPQKWFTYQNLQNFLRIWTVTLLTLLLNYI